MSSWLLIVYGILIPMATTRKSTEAKIKTTAKATSRTKTVKKAVKKPAKKALKTTKSVAAKANKPSLFAKLFRTGKKTNRKVTANSGLRKLNAIMSVLYFGQGVALLLLSNAKTFPVSTSFLNVDQLASQSGETVLAPASQVIFDVRYAYLLAVLLFVAGITHLLVATAYRKQYEADLQKGANRARWIEASIGSGLILTIVASLVGVYDLASLIMIWSLALMLNLLALAVERYNIRQPLAYIVGLIAGVTPWLVTGIYLWHAHIYGAGQIPAFVYYVYGSMLAIFAGLGLMLLVQYQKRGRWADYAYGERAFVVMGFIAKTALAWQVFYGLLR